MGSRHLIAIKEMGETLAPGQSRRGICPWCNGGHTKEVSFVVRNINGAITYRCYRATCSGLNPSSGKIGGGVPARGTYVNEPTKRDLRPFTDPLESLPGEWLSFYRERFGLTAAELSAAGFKYAPKQHRIYMPIFGPTGNRRGAILRSYEDTTKYKAISYPETHLPWQGFYQLGLARPVGIVNPKTLVLVEDQVSALKAARYYHTVALLGTVFTRDKAAEIAGLNARNVLVALDNDAADQGIDIMRENMLLLKGMSVVLLQDDLKDVDDSEIIERIEAAKTG